MAKEDHQQLEDLFDLALKEAQQPEDHITLSVGLEDGNNPLKNEPFSFTNTPTTVVEDSTKPQENTSTVIIILPPEKVKLSKKQKTMVKAETAGKDWFDMKAAKMTPELEQEFKLLRLRGLMDPKRHYKKEDSKQPPPKYFQVGTIKEGPTEFFSARMSKKERGKTLLDDLLEDSNKQKSIKRRFLDLQLKNQRGGRERLKRPRR